MEGVQSFSIELKTLFEEDQQDRKIGVWETDPSRDQHRLGRVLELMSEGNITLPEDCYRAALVLQHGNAVEHFIAAQQLARRAFDEGYSSKEGEPDPLWLSAAAEDRALVAQGLPQKYGTQYSRFEDGTWSFSTDIDPNISDEERRKMHVPSLAEAQRKLQEYQRAEKVNF